MVELARVGGPGRHVPDHRLRRLVSAWAHRVAGNLRANHPPVLVVEIVLVAAGYVAYSLVRNAAPEQSAAAIARGFDLLAFERGLQLDVELWVNHAADSVTWLVVAMNYFYATMHFVVSIGVLVWLFVAHQGRYRPLRTALFSATGLALVGYYTYALAPPRLLPGAGFVDTVLVHHTWGSLASGDLQGLSNQYAAMPSMHAGWSLWCGIAIVLFAQRRWVRALGVAYPVATLAVIVATGNHFVLDAVAGWLLVAIGFGIQHAVHGRPAGEYPRRAVDAERAHAAVPTEASRVT